MASDPEPAGVAGGGLADLADGGAGQYLDAVAGELVVDAGAEFGVDGGQDLRQLFHLGDGQAAGGERVGHFQADVSGADDHRRRRAGLLQGRVIRAKVSPMECSRCTPSAGPSWSRPLIGGRTGTAPVPMMSLS